VPNFEDFSRRENEPSRIKSLDELSAEIKNVNSEWLKMINIDEHKLRLREADILKALSCLELTENWKSKNIDLVVNFIQVADTRNLINELKRIFFLDSVPESTVAAKQVADKLGFVKNRKN
jgi:hypothetical protein